MIGSAWRALRRVADEIDADVVVCGSRGLGAFSRAAVGSTSTGLLHHAGRPVLVVPSDTGRARRPAGDRLRRLGAGARRDRRRRPPARGPRGGRRPCQESLIRHSLSGRAITALPGDQLQAVVGDVDEHFRERAAAVAAEGAELAREHRLEARPGGRGLGPGATCSPPRAAPPRRR